MKNLKLLLLTMLLVIGSVQLKGQEAIPLSLKNAIDLMLDKNFDIQIVAKQIESAKQNLGLGSAGFYPLIDVGGSQNNRYNNANTLVTTNNRDESVSRNIIAYAELNWTLFNGFVAHIRKDKYKLLVNLSEGNAALVVENKIQALVLAYYQALLNIEKLKTIEKVKTLSNSRIDYLLNKKHNNEDLNYEVLQAQNAFLSDSTNYLLQQLELKKSLLNLNLLLGVDKSSKFELTDDFNVLEADYDYTAIESKMLSNNKTLTNEYINQEILKKNTSFSRVPLYPSIQLSSGSDYSNSRLIYDGMYRMDTYSFDFYANFSLSFNLFNGGKTRNAIQEAHIQEEIGKLEFDQIKQRLSNTLETIFDMYSIRKKLLTVADLSLEKAELNLQLSTERLQSSAINAFNYRDVQLAYVNSAFNQLDAVYDLLDANTEILRLSGSIISEYE